MDSLGTAVRRGDVPAWWVRLSALREEFALSSLRIGDSTVTPEGNAPPESTPKTLAKWIPGAFSVYVAGSLRNTDGLTSSRFLLILSGSLR